MINSICAVVKGSTVEQIGYVFLQIKRLLLRVKNKVIRLIILIVAISLFILVRIIIVKV